jgi:hypothetical protein
VAKPDPTLGIPYQFNADAFRTAIRFVFEMAEPPEQERAVTFHFADTVAFNGPADGEQVPFDPAETIVRTTPAPVRRPCDVEFVKASDEPTAFGIVIPAKVKVTLLDVDYEDVKEATFIIVNGDRYLRHYEPPAYGLFDVGLHEMVFIAENER